MGPSAEQKGQSLHPSARQDDLVDDIDLLESPQRQSFIVGIVSPNKIIVFVVSVLPM